MLFFFFLFFPPLSQIHEGGLLITEGSPISPETQYEFAAGIYTDKQTESWKHVVDAVHARGGVIAIQLWHLGSEKRCVFVWIVDFYLFLGFFFFFEKKECVMPALVKTPF